MGTPSVATPRTWRAAVPLVRCRKPTSARHSTNTTSTHRPMRPTRPRRRAGSRLEGWLVTPERGLRPSRQFVGAARHFREQVGRALRPAAPPFEGRSRLPDVVEQLDDPLAGRRGEIIAGLEHETSGLRGGAGRTTDGIQGGHPTAGTALRTPQRPGPAGTQPSRRYCWVSATQYPAPTGRMSSSNTAPRMVHHRRVAAFRAGDAFPAFSAA